MTAQSGTGGLTFDWLLRDRISRHLLKFLFFSLLLHALGFYVFQVVYPSNVSIAPPPAVLHLLTPSSPENRALLEWIAAEDPALVATPQGALPAQLLDFPYKPSFTETHSLPRVFVENPAPVAFPPAKDILSFVQGATRPAPKKQGALPAPQTRVQFSGDLSGRTPVGNPPVRLASKSGATLEPASFLLAVTPDGGVPFVFLQKSSGDKALDREAEAHLARLKFAPAEGEAAWGTATFFWGNDAFDDGAGATRKAESGKPAASPQSAEVAAGNRGGRKTGEPIRNPQSR